MTDMGLTVRDALKVDLESLVTIHVSAFPGFFLTKMGRRFLKQYYYGYLEMGETLLVAVDSENKIVGFVAGLKDSEGYYRYMKKYWYRFIFPVTLAMLNFDLLVTCSQRILTIFRSNKINEEMSVPVGFHELTSIAVSPTARQVGAGKLLMGAYLDAVKTVPDIKGVFLTTDSKENANVRQFYKSMGFQVKGDFVQGGKRKMSAYALKFN